MAQKKRSERSYGLSAEEVAALKAEFAESKQLPNPFHKGAFHFTLDGLLALGANEFHQLSKVHEAFKKAAGAEWYAAWASKEARTEKGKDADGRFIQNLRVLQRTADYGKRLLDAGKRILGSKGAVIDLSRADDGTLIVRLNLDSNSPTKPGHRQKEGAAPKAAKAKKPRKGNRAAHKNGGKEKGQKGKPKARKAQN